MRCFLCKGPVTTRWFRQGGRSVECPQCGPYRIRGNVLAAQAAHRLQFDLPETMAFLDAERRRGAESPEITLETVHWLEEPASCLPYRVARRPH